MDLMPSHLLAAVSLAALSVCAISSAPPDTGTIAGSVLDANGAPVAGAEVVLTAGATGYPMRSGTSDSVFSPAKAPGESALGNWWTATTGADGGFQFKDVAPGTYRLLAQSWSTGDQVEEDHGAGNGLRMMRASKGATARGVANVEVASGATVSASIRPLGDVVFSYELGASNNDWYLLISTSPPAADPILGFVGWRGAFARDAVALVRMRYGRAKVQGLPKQPLHYAVFASDSLPGFCTGSFRGDESTLHVHKTPLLNGWSHVDGHPSKELAPLVAVVAKLRVAHGKDLVLRRLIAGREEAWKSADEAQAPALMKNLIRADVLGPLTRRVRLVDNGPTHSVADLLAADAYATIAANSQAREKRKSP